ncbi:MAG TPA: CPBP family intramembrane glutamic endopeptidase [Bacteroidales bacterium]|nr:CPBP family intramembrane glutamic endopeptidase [Bacteroidales bacterium]
MDKISKRNIVFLHLFPGVLILGIYLLITPFIHSMGYPSLMSLMIAFLMVILPAELGYLIWKAKKSTVDKPFLQRILVNKPVEKKKFLGIISIGVIAIFIIAGGMSLMDESIKTQVFGWLPDWYFYDSEFFNGYSRQALVITAVFRIGIDGLLIPFTEEWYFRGYLLPRMQGKGVAVPVLASLLFALYHFWQPWNYLTLILISAILVFPAWYFKNYKISLYIHLIINLTGAILFLLMVL